MEVVYRSFRTAHGLCVLVQVIGRGGRGVEAFLEQNG